MSLSITLYKQSPKINNHGGQKSLGQTESKSGCKSNSDDLGLSLGSTFKQQAVKSAREGLEKAGIGGGVVALAICHDEDNNNYYG